MFPCVWTTQKVHLVQEFLNLAMSLKQMLKYVNPFLYFCQLFCKPRRQYCATLSTFSKCTKNSNDLGKHWTPEISCVTSIEFGEANSMLRQNVGPCLFTPKYKINDKHCMQVMYHEDRRFRWSANWQVHHKLNKICQVMADIRWP